MTDLNSIETLCQAYVKVRDEIDAIKETLSAKETEKRELEARIIASLDESQKPRWDLPGVGTLSVVNKFNFSSPKTPEAKGQFFNFLKDRGIFEDMVSVNHQTLNAFCKRELELAKDEGKTEFQIPGIDEPTLFKTISLRKS